MSEEGISMPPMGTHEGLTAAGVYNDLVDGLKQQVMDLRRDKAIWQLVGLLLLIGVLVMLPLRKRIPYFFETDSSTGRVTMTNRVAEELKVSDKNIAYFLRLWTARLTIINAATLKEGLPSAYKWTRGGAVRELDDWTEKVDKTAERIARTPGLTREILGVPNVSFNEDRTVAFIDFIWIEKVLGVERERRRKLLTVEYGAAPPKDDDQDPDNPLGLGITHWTLNDQVEAR